MRQSTTYRRVLPGINSGEIHLSDISRADEFGRRDELFTRRDRYYMLAVLTTVYIFNFIDRQILVILQEDIKAELLLSDTQLGLLSGFSFDVFRG